MAVDHRAGVDIGADVDVHRRHADHSRRDVRPVADARPPGDEAHIVLERGGTNWISVLVEEREARVRGHVDQRPHAEAEQDALLDPGVDAPGAAGAPLGRADLTPGERSAEFGEQGAVGVVVAVVMSGAALVTAATSPSPPRGRRGRGWASSPDSTRKPAGRSRRMAMSCPKSPDACLTPRMFSTSRARASVVAAARLDAVRPGTLYSTTGESPTASATARKWAARPGCVGLL